MRRPTRKFGLRVSPDVFCLLKVIVRSALVEANISAGILRNREEAEKARAAEEFVGEIRALIVELDNANERWFAAPHRRFDAKIARIKSGKLTKAERKQARKLMRAEGVVQ